MGESATTAAMVILPTNEEAGVNLTSLSESVMFRFGTYVEVPIATQFVGISKKLAQQARRAMTEGGTFANVVQSERCQRFAASKVSRSPLGSGLHQTWIRDLLKTCTTKALYICDFVHGTGEVAKAAITSKVSVEATGAGVRLCVWAHDPRRIFADIGRAVGRSELTSQYLQRKLQVPGHTPVPDPGDRPVKSRKLLKAMIGAPLRILSMDS